MTVRRSLPYSLRRSALPSFPIGQKLANWHLPRRIYFAIYQKTVSFSTSVIGGSFFWRDHRRRGALSNHPRGRSTSFSRRCLIESFFKLRRRDKVREMLGLVRNNRKDVGRQRSKLFSCAHRLGIARMLSWRMSNAILACALQVNRSKRKRLFHEICFFPFFFIGTRLKYS